MDLTDDPAVAVLLTYPKEIKKTCILKNLYIETCKLSYVIRIASPGLMRDTGCWGLVHWDDPEGWYGEGGGKGVQDGEHMYTRDGFKSMYGETNIIL